MDVRRVGGFRWSTSRRIGSSNGSALGGLTT